MKLSTKRISKLTKIILFDTLWGKRNQLYLDRGAHENENMVQAF